MMERNCMNCLQAVGNSAAGELGKWHRRLNEFSVNARMTCEEWCGYKSYDGFGIRVTKAMRKERR